ATRALENTAGGDLALRVLNALAPAATQPQAAARTHGLIELWAQGKPAFGVYAPNENPGPRGPRGQPPQPAVYTRAGGEKLAMNPLYDYVDRKSTRLNSS